MQGLSVHSTEEKAPRAKPIKAEQRNDAFNSSLPRQLPSSIGVALVRWRTQRTRFPREGFSSSSV